MSRHSSPPARPRASSNLAATRPSHPRDDTISNGRHNNNIYASSTRPSAVNRAPSPLQSTHFTYERPPNERVVRSAGLSPASPYSSATSYSAASSRPAVSTPPSPIRQKGSTGDRTFDSLKATASRHAVLERTRDEQKQRARDERLHSQAGARGVPASASVQAMSTGSRTTPSPRLPALTTHVQNADQTGVRTASLDSTISLSQSPSQAFQPQLPPLENPEAVDIPALIAAAGSPEAAIRKLIQEKDEAARTNAQLWRLMNKQRTMMADLHKDLQKVTKDKDRYRRKLKEQLMNSASLSTIQGSAVAARSHAGDEQDDSRSPAISESMDDMVDMDSRQPSITSERPTIDNVYSPSYSTSNFTSPEPTSLLVSPMHANPMSAPFPDQNDSKPSLKLPNLIEPRSPGAPERRPSPGSPAIRVQTPPANKMTPNQGFALAKKERAQSIGRKGPPAPLDLSPRKNSQMLDGSSSEYADSSGGSLEADRGRTKHRGDDGNRPDLETRERGDQGKKARQDAEKQRLARSQYPELERDVSNNTIGSEGYSSPEPGSPQVAEVQTYQSLNALNTTVRTPQGQGFADQLKKSMAQNSLSSPGLSTAQSTGRPGTAPTPRNPTFSTFPNTRPVSPRNAGAALSPRAPKQPVHLPQQTPHSDASPHLAPADSYQKHEYTTEAGEADPRLSNDTGSPAPADTVEPASLRPRSPGDIYKGFMTDDWPGLLLPPTALSAIAVKVDSSRLRPSRYSYMAPKASQENPVFSLAICAKSDGAQLWRVEKTLASLIQLDLQLKTVARSKLRLPDRSLFQGHAPARIDARRTALAKYFSNLLEEDLDERAASVVCDFFSTDAIGAEVQDYYTVSHTPSSSLDTIGEAKPKPRKDGYLTKKGKNFGGWIARYFVLDGPVLKYFEAPGGAQLGAIKLQYASIGRQTAKSAQEDLDEENQYRHAFLILEPKKRDRQNYVKHVLCAESDEERDSWVKCMLQYVEEEGKRPQTAKLVDKPDSPKSPRAHKSLNDIKKQDPPVTPSSVEMPSQLRTVMYDSTTAAEAPVMGGPAVPNRSEPSGLPEVDALKSPATPLPIISGPTNGAKIEDAGFWGNRRGPNVLTKQPKEIDKDSNKEKEKDKDRKRSIFTFKSRTSSDSVPKEASFAKDQSSEPPQLPRQVFGMALSDVVDFAGPTDTPVRLPAVVYRCIEYLRAHDAVHEEGIFRMSGSNLVIRGLKERFNNEGDVQLLAPGEQVYDIHAVASLLKLYLRELPTTILTRDLHLDFTTCLERITDHDLRLEAFNVLVNRLPLANRELLEKLTAFLREIVDNEPVNKMSVRNVGIVFSPTLHIPAPLISIFVTDHAKIFGPPVDVASVESLLPQILSAMASKKDKSLTLNTGDARAQRYQLHPDVNTPSSDVSFMQNLTMTDYTMAQRMVKEQYDISYTPPQSATPVDRTPSGSFPPNDVQTQGLLQGALRKVSEASEPPSQPQSPLKLAFFKGVSSQPHTSFHSMHFPDPPNTAGLDHAPPLPRSHQGSTSGLSNVTGPYGNSPQSSHSSTSTLTTGQLRDSISSNLNAQGRSASGTGPSFTLAKSNLGNLNDITISSSPLMGGTSPQFNRASFSPFGQPVLTFNDRPLESSATAPQISSVGVASPLSTMQTSSSGPTLGFSHNNTNTGKTDNPYSPSMYSAHSGSNSVSPNKSPNPYAPSASNPYSPNAHVDARNASVGSGGTAERIGHNKQSPAEERRTGSVGSGKSAGTGSGRSSPATGEKADPKSTRRLLRRQSGNFLVRAGLLPEDGKKEKQNGFPAGNNGLHSPREGKVLGMGLGVSSPRTGSFGK